MFSLNHDSSDGFTSGPIGFSTFFQEKLRMGDEISLPFEDGFAWFQVISIRGQLVHAVKPEYIQEFDNFQAYDEVYLTLAEASSKPRRRV